MGLYSQQFDDRRTTGPSPSASTGASTGASSPAARQVGPSRRIDMAPTGQRMLPSESRGSGASIQYRNLKRLVADRLQPGKTYTADFIKRTTGGRRRMRFRTDIPSRFRGQRPRTWNPARYNLRNVLDVDRDEPRMLNLDALIRVQPEDDGVEYRRWRGARVNLPRDQREYTKTPTERQFYPFGFKPDDDPAAPPMPEYRTEEGRRSLAQQLGQFDEPRMSAQLFAIRPQTGRRQYIQQLRDYLSGAEKHPPADQEDTRAVAEDAPRGQWPTWRMSEESLQDLRDDVRHRNEPNEDGPRSRDTLRKRLYNRRKPDVRKDPRGGIEFDPDEMGDGDATDEERRMIVGGDVMDRRIRAVGGQGDQPHHAKARAAVMRGGELQDYELERGDASEGSWKEDAWWPKDEASVAGVVPKNVNESLYKLAVRHGDDVEITGEDQTRDKVLSESSEGLGLSANIRGSQNLREALRSHDPLVLAGIRPVPIAKYRSGYTPSDNPQWRHGIGEAPSRAAYTREDMDAMNRLADEDDQPFAARPMQQRSLLQAGRYAPGQFAPSGMADRQAQSMGVGLQRFSNGAVPASWSRLADTASHYNPLKTYSVARKAGHGRIKSALISGAAHGSDMFNPLAGPENARRVRGELQDDQQFATEDQAALGQLPQGLLDALRYVQVPAIGMSPTGAVMPPMAPMGQQAFDEEEDDEPIVVAPDDDWAMPEQTIRVNQHMPEASIADTGIEQWSKILRSRRGLSGMKSAQYGNRKYLPGDRKMTPERGEEIVSQNAPAPAETPEQRMARMMAAKRNQGFQAFAVTDQERELDRRMASPGAGLLERSRQGMRRGDQSRPNLVSGTSSPSADRSKGSSGRHGRAMTAGGAKRDSLAYGLMEAESPGSVRAYRNAKMPAMDVRDAAAAGKDKWFGNTYKGNRNVAWEKDLRDLDNDPRYARNVNTSGLELEPEPFPRKMRAMPGGSTSSDVHRSLGLSGANPSLVAAPPSLGRSGSTQLGPQPQPQQAPKMNAGRGRQLSARYRGILSRGNAMRRGGRMGGMGQRLGGFVQGIANGMDNFRNDFRRGVKRSALSNRQMRRRQPFSAMPQDQDFSGGIASPWIRRGIETAQAIGGAFDPRATYQTLRGKGYGPRTSGGIAGVAHTLDATVIPGPLMSTLAKRLPARRTA